jgi:hypothetical protein
MLTTSQEQPSGMPAASPADRIRLPAARPPGHLAASWLGRVLLAAGLGMIPWVVILARAPPPAAMAAHWATAWVARIPEKVAAANTELAWYGTHHVYFWLAYQPAGRYWLFRFAEFGVLLVVSALLVMLTLRIARRRAAG